MLRTMLAIATLLIAQTTLAIPVTGVHGGVLRWDLDWLIQLDDSPSYPDDFTFGDSINGGPYNISLNDAGREASVSIAGTYSTNLFTSAELVDFTIFVNLAAAAHVAANLPGAIAQANSGTMGLIFGVEVLEDVLYTGPTELFSNSGGHARLSGSILEPGSYYSSFYDSASVSALAYSGDSVSNAASFGYNFAFASVPTPATLSLIALGVLGIAIRRRARRG